MNFFKSNVYDHKADCLEKFHFLEENGFSVKSYQCNGENEIVYTKDDFEILCSYDTYTKTCDIIISKGHIHTNMNACDFLSDKERGQIIEIGHKSKIRELSESFSLLSGLVRKYFENIKAIDLKTFGSIYLKNEHV